MRFELDVVVNLLADRCAKVVSLFANQLHSSRWLKAIGYAEAVGVHLVFVFLAMPWVRDAARLAFIDVPSTSALIVADWSRHNFGQLPFPKWGEAVVE